MADFDIGTLLFRDILRVTFTSSGNPINDLVMYFFIPTVFMILFVVIITGKLPYLQNNSKMRLLFAIAVYLYIIFGGYFQFFVSLSGPVLMILIFFLGILWFIGGHFGGKKGMPGGGGGSQQPQHYASAGAAGRYAHYENMGWQDLRVEEKRIEADIKSVNDQIKESHRNKEAGRLEELRGRLAMLTGELNEVRVQKDVAKKTARRFGLAS